MFAPAFFVGYQGGAPALASLVRQVLGCRMHLAIPWAVVAPFVIFAACIQCRCKLTLALYMVLP